MAAIELTVDEAYKIADNFKQASGRILDFRIANRSALSSDESDKLEMSEDRLDQMVVLFRGYGIKLIAENAQEAVNELKTAIDLGKNTLAKIKKIKKAIEIASALADLAAAVLAAPLTMNPKAVLTAVENVRTVTQEAK